MKKHNCEECKLRGKYDQNPTSMVGKFWRWHINFCPGWKRYMKSLDKDKKTEIAAKYKIDLMY